MRACCFNVAFEHNDGILVQGSVHVHTFALSFVKA